MAHARDEHGLVDPDTAAGTTLAQVLDAQGTPSRSTPASLTPLLDPATAARAVRGSVRNDDHDSALRRPVARVGGADRRPESATVAVARSLDQRDETLDHLLRELLIASPLALLLASLAGYGLAAAALRPVEAMRVAG